MDPAPADPATMSSSYSQHSHRSAAMSIVVRP